MDSLVQATDLVVSLSSRVVLGPLSLTVNPGEKIAIVGGNGSGKTTLLRTLAGLTAPHRGALQVAAQRCCYMPDSAPLEAHLSVRDLLREWASLRHTNLAQVDSVIQQLDLVHVAQRSCAQLSLGFRQRVALAMSLVANPDLLLLDEPSNGLDPHHQQMLHDVLSRFSGSLMVVTHQLAAWQSLCARVIVLQHGEIVFDGASNDARIAEVHHA